MLPATVRIFFCTVPLDMRKSFDGLALAARELLEQDPRSGALFVFTNRGATRAKVLWWDANGYCVLAKRMHQAVAALPPRSSDERALKIDGSALGKLLAGMKREKKRPGKKLLDS